VKTITLRNLPPELARRLEAKARELGSSLEEAVILLLEERLMSRPPASPSERHRDLDFLAGSSTAEEADELDCGLQEQRRIEPELWR
jgi:plasmid stability protein